MTEKAPPFQIRDHESGFGPVLILSSDQNMDVTQILSDFGARSLRLSASAGWSASDLSVLDRIRPGSIDSLEIYSEKISDLSVLQKFVSIKMIGLQTKGTLGFATSTFPNLEVLFGRFTKPESLDQLPNPLRVLKLVDFAGADLLSIPDAPNLKRLDVYGKELQSIKGLERYKHLTKLIVGEANLLTDIESAGKLDGLEDLTIDGARQLSSLIGLSENRNLKRLVLERCGNIETIAPLANLVLLEELIIGESMSVLDGDLSVLDHLQHLRRLVLTPRRGYSPPANEIRTRMASRA
jgi:Leucine-rich repeat (LRR) protein